MISAPSLWKQEIKVWKHEFESSQHDTVKSDNRVPTKKHHICILYICIWICMWYVQHICVYIYQKHPVASVLSFRPLPCRWHHLQEFGRVDRAVGFGTPMPHTERGMCVHIPQYHKEHVLPMWKSQPLKLGFGFESAEFLHLTINLKPLDQIQEVVASSHSMFPHSHDLWNLPSHGDIQATDSWKHLALFCSLRQTAQRSSLRSRLAESKHWSWNHSQLDQDLRRTCEASLLCQKAENCSAPKANELLLVVSSCHPSGAHREPTLTSCQSGIMAELLLAKWNAFKSHTPLEVAVHLAKKMKNDVISIPNENARNICWDLPAVAYCS